MRHSDPGPFEVLSLRKTHAIKSLNIETAAKIESEIQTHLQTELLQMIDAAKARLTDEITQLHSEYTQTCDRIRESSDYEFLEFRVSIDDAFAFWQRGHIEELSTLEKEYALAVVREGRRPIKAKLDFEMQARELAKQNEFEASIRSREKSQVAEQTELERRRAAVDGAFDRKRHALLERQQNDLQNLRMKFEQGIQVLEQDLQEKLDKEQRSFLVAVRAAVQREILAGIASVKSSSLKKRVSGEIARAANDVTLAMAGLRLAPTPVAMPRKQERPATHASKNFMPELEPLPVDDESVEDAEPGD
jgi:hypothetical protein